VKFALIAVTTNIMSSQLFESREDDLRQICENVQRKLTDQLPRCVGGGWGDSTEVHVTVK